LLGLPIFLYHVVPIGIDNTGKDVGVQLRVFDLAEVFGQSLVWLSLGPLLASFVPTYPPSLDVLSPVDPRLLHDSHCIGSFWGRGERLVFTMCATVTKW
jgi:hypothetical protein